MTYPHDRYEVMNVPRLSEDVKRLNGKSTRELHRCIDSLNDVLEEEHHKPPERPVESSKSDDAH